MRAMQGWGKLYWIDSRIAKDEHFTAFVGRLVQRMAFT